MDSDEFAEEYAPDARLYNDDLAPTMPAQRTWGTYNYVALWFSMSMEVTTYMLAASLIAGGMNWKQAVGTILLGNLIVLVPMLLNAHAGAKYGIPFPVFVRASFGPVGANIPAMLRAIVACGWFGIQTWIGGDALFKMLRLWIPFFNGLPQIFSASFGLATGPAITFFLFWLVNMLVVYLGVESIRKLLVFKAFFLPAAALALLIWAISSVNGGLSDILNQPSKFTDSSSFFKFFFPALTGMVGFWATLSLNIPDFTRYAKNQDAQIVGQAFGLPVAMTLYAFLCIACTSASASIFGKPIWSPVELLGRFHQPLLAFLGLIALLVATLNVNIGANVVGPSNDFANLAPKYISFRTGGLITGSLGLL